VPEIAIKGGEIMLKANIEKASNGFIVHLFGDKNKIMIAKTAKELAEIIEKEIK